MSKNKYQILSETKTLKSFSYQRGTVSLGFTLNVDTDTEVKDFKLLLEKAVADLSALVEGNQNDGKNARK